MANFMYMTKFITLSVPVVFILFNRSNFIWGPEGLQFPPLQGQASNWKCFWHFGSKVAHPGASHWMLHWHSWRDHPGMSDLAQLSGCQWPRSGRIQPLHSPHHVWSRWQPGRMERIDSGWHQLPKHQQVQRCTSNAGRTGCPGNF